MKTFTSDESISDADQVGYVDVDGVAGFNETAQDVAVFADDLIATNVTVKSLFKCEEW